MGLPPMFKLPPALVQRGHKVHWLVFDAPSPLVIRRATLEQAKTPYIYPKEIRISNQVDTCYLSISGIQVHVQTLPAQRVLSWLLRSPLRRFKVYGLAYHSLAFAYALPFARKLKPDLIYGQSPYISALLGRVLGLPVILRLYGTFLYPYLHPWPRRIRRLGEFLVFRLPYEYLIITNDGTRGDEVACAMGVAPSKVCFWMDGVDKEWGRESDSRDCSRIRETLGIAPDSKILLTVSRLEDWKRVDRIITALPAILACHPNTYLVVVGDGSQRLALEDLCHKLGVHQRVCFVGQVPHDSVRDYMQVADIFVSLYELSNLCDPVLEAMICGRCVISLADGSLEHVIDSGNTGILLPSDNLESELPKTVIELLRRPERIREIGQQAQEYARCHFWSWDERIERECELLERLVQSSFDTSA